jgi:hypothetical protein
MLIAKWNHHDQAPKEESHQAAMTHDPYRKPTNMQKKEGDEASLQI